MLVSGIPDAVVGTNCWVLAPGQGEECLVVDPGFDVLDRLEETLLEHRLRPAAVLLTHGHADHVWSVTPVCGARGIPALVHGDDVHRLADPLAGVGPELRAMLESRFGAAARWSEPEDVQTLTDRQRLDLAGLGVEVLHAPGHTEGSVVFVLDDVPAETSVAPGPGERAAFTSTLLSGDVLFAGSIGRTDLPGGDMAAMQRSLRDVVLPMPDDRLVLPGHGGATTIAWERSANPYLRQLS